MIPASKSKAAAAESSRALGPPGPPADPPSDADAFSVVGIGASAGGLEACTKLIGALPATTGMAFILVQHLDPNHESLLVELLSAHTPMIVRQAAEGMVVERDHLYVIAPGTYLSARGGALHLSRPRDRHGARLPFDHLLRSLAEAYGRRTSAVVLSGTGADGSLGLEAVHAAGGFVIAQDPGEAGYDGMPRNAIATGSVDLVLPAAAIPAALVEHDATFAFGARGRTPLGGNADALAGIVDLLRMRTPHDFTGYKQGTVRRRVERRMGLASLAADQMARYLETLRDDPAERDRLAKDLLINVTGFFRDGTVFDLLARNIVPDLVRAHATDHPLRVWIAGCSTGEEAYSIAMLFREEITAARRNVKLQVFASDVDAEAIAAARDGLYPPTIAADVTPERLARFFSREDHGYVIAPELRACVVFTVHDVLADPPFSRLDLVSCRNLLIYLDAEAQAKVVASFDFALNEGGILLLGSAENVVGPEGHFEPIAKPERLFRHLGRGRAGGLDPGQRALKGSRASDRPARDRVRPPRPSFADLCRDIVLERHAPAAVLVNAQHEVVFSLGPTDRYLRVARGPPTHDVLAMVHRSVRARLRSAIEQAHRENVATTVSGALAREAGDAIGFRIVVEAVPDDDRDLLLVCFLDEIKPKAVGGGLPDGASRMAELERELDTTRTELHDVVRTLDRVRYDQRAVNQEALSVNEEYQSTNEELLTSK